MREYGSVVAVKGAGDIYPIMPLYICSEDGMIVGDTEQHETWHTNMERRLSILTDNVSYRRKGW